MEQPDYFGSLHSTDDVDGFICPISRTLMKDPVVAADGHTYERKSIEKWFAQSATNAAALARQARAEGLDVASTAGPISPLTGAPFEATTLLPNHALRKAIQELLSSRPDLAKEHDEESKQTSAELGRVECKHVDGEEVKHSPSIVSPTADADDGEETKHSSSIVSPADVSLGYIAGGKGGEVKTNLGKESGGTTQALGPAASVLVKSDVIVSGGGFSLYDTWGVLNTYIDNAAVCAARAVVAKGGWASGAAVPAWQQSWAHVSNVSSANAGGHSDHVTSLSIIPVGAPGAPASGCLLATGSRDRVVCLWQPARRFSPSGDKEGDRGEGGWELVQTLSGHSDAIHCVAGLQVAHCAAHARPLVVSGGRDCTLRLWAPVVAIGAADELLGAAGRSPLRKASTLAEPQQEQDSLSSLPDAWLDGSGGSDGSPELYASSPWACEAVLRGHKDFVNCCALQAPLGGSSGESLQLASGGADWDVRLWDLGRPDAGALQTLSGHSYAVRCVAWAHDAVGCWARSGKLVRPGGGGNGGSHAVSPLLASGADDEIVRVWDARVKYGGKVAQLKTGSRVLCCCWGGAEGGAPWLAAGGGDRSTDTFSASSANVGGWLRVWDPRNWRPVADCALTEVVEGVDLSSHDHSRMWEGEMSSRMAPRRSEGDINRARTAHDSAVTSCTALRLDPALSGGGGGIVTAGDDKKMRLWRVPALVAEKELDPKAIRASSSSSSSSVAPAHTAELLGTLQRGHSLAVECVVSPPLALFPRLFNGGGGGGGGGRHDEPSIAKPTSQLPAAADVSLGGVERRASSRGENYLSVSGSLGDSTRRAHRMNSYSM